MSNGTKTWLNDLVWSRRIDWGIRGTNKPQWKYFFNLQVFLRKLTSIYSNLITIGWLMIQIRKIFFWVVDVGRGEIENFWSFKIVEPQILLLSQIPARQSTCDSIKDEVKKYLRFFSYFQKLIFEYRKVKKYFQK